MNANQLLADLQTQDIKITATGGKLRIDAPKGVLVPSLETQLRLHKKELLDVLTAPMFPGLAPAPAAGPSITLDVPITHDLPNGRWVLPEIADLYKDTPAEVWTEGVELFQEGIGFFRFYSLEELEGATIGR